MNEKNFVEEVVSELKKRLDLPENSSLAVKSKAAVIGNLKEADCRILKQSHRLIPLNEAQDYNVIIIAELSDSLLGQIGLGLPVSFEAEAVLRFLMEGKIVYAAESGIAYRKYRNTSTKNLYLVFQDYEERMVRYGVRILEDILDIQADGRQFKPESHMACGFGGRMPEGFDLTNQKLIRESDLQKAKSKGFAVISVDLNAIITPLAGDYITNHNLSVKRMKKG